MTECSTSDSLGDIFLDSESCFIAVMCHSSTRPGTSYHVTQFYQAFPCVSTASELTNAGARRPGYEANGQLGWTTGIDYSVEPPFTAK